MSEEKLSESTTCMRYIDPKLKESGWDPIENIIREYHITKGQIVPSGKSGTNCISTLHRILIVMAV